MGKTATLANIGSVADSSLGFRNRIINGAMVIDQRNGGAEVNPATNAIYLDRWTSRSSQASKFKIQQVTTAPTGFSNSLLITSLSSYSIAAADYFTVDQRIETANVIDFAWGTAAGSPAVLSFWVRSSLTGTFTGAIAEYNSASATYGFSYTINAANTWEYKTVPIPCPTIGTWNTTLNGGYMTVTWGLGVGSDETTASNGSWLAVSKRAGTGGTSVVGTSGATWQVTGVQLEKGATATSFDYRPYGTELALCQRYFWKTLAANSHPGIWSGGGSSVSLLIKHPVTMRSGPSASLSGTVAVYSFTVADANSLTYSTIASDVDATKIVCTTTGAGASAGGLSGFTYSTGSILFSSEL